MPITNQIANLPGQLVILDGKTTPTNDYTERMLVAMFSLDGHIWFFKMMGEKYAVMKYESDFQSYVSKFNLNNETKINKLLSVISSLKLTVILLFLISILVFIATLAQVDIGIFYTRKEYFLPLFVTKELFGINVPVFPGGALLGILLFLNLIAAHFKRFVFSFKKAGIWLIHIGLLVLLVGCGLNSCVNQESMMSLYLGESRNFSEDYNQSEIAVQYNVDLKNDRLITHRFDRKQIDKALQFQDIPFKLRVIEFLKTHI